MDIEISLADDIASQPSSIDLEMPTPPQDVRDEVLVDRKPGAADQPVPTGMTLGSKELYREDERYPWDDWSPDDIDLDPEETPEAKKYALIVRREKSVAQNSSLVLHSVSVQSPLIRKVLGVVFDGYKGMTTKLKDLTFNAPFHEFFYRWDCFQQQIREETDDLVLEHIMLLQNVISGEIQPHLEKRQELLDNGLVTFDYLWALFEPDAVIYRQSDGQDRLYKLVDSSYRRFGDDVFLILTCRYIDCDGAAFGYVTTSLTLGNFDGIKPISELSIMPIHLHSRIGEIWDALQKRGKSFVQLNGFHYRSYSGLCTMNERHFGSSGKRNIDDGRIIIDTKLWSTYNPQQTLTLEPVDTPPSGVQSNEDDFPPSSSSEFGFDENHPHAPAVRAVEATGRDEQRYMNGKRRPKDVQAKTQFYVDSVREIRWNLEAFQRLVLPHDYKEIIWAFVESQLSHENSFDDVVEGKVAEEMRKPLYSMSAGELGHSANEVEEQLHKVLELSTKWGAILLIDECDVFLERRTTSDLERNKLVSGEMDSIGFTKFGPPIFLRLLEYYKGVMFLTTNRVSTFDTAFQSRIHLTIDYPKLDFRAKMLVWRTFVRPQSEASQYASIIEEKDLKALAKIDMNGREIKNTVKTARLLASQKGVPLAMEHVATVLRVKDGSSVVGKSPRSMDGFN
ncbi:hypothetical protein HO133_002580 [Letharia lupina]|uniref:ATPase AAA-type core domain-containing protein n=1 Tax=Letharia lupina TaxID=560253 RepID=A0A8H6CCL6_9LECA|nr:uncharacterized protein HO133_002580 [Letharia lupina]KAF6220900.1 hypothetical protein HO133_002580 [Letharia lupina]